MKTSNLAIKFQPRPRLGADFRFSLGVPCGRAQRPVTTLRSDKVTGAVTNVSQGDVRMKQEENGREPDATHLTGGKGENINTTSGRYH